MSAFLEDLRFGLRMLRKTPGITAIAILTLGLGIGANAAIFSVVEAVLLRPLPYADPDRLVRVHGSYTPRGLTGVTVSPLDVADFRSQSQSFEELASLNSQTLVLTGRGEPRPLRVGNASPAAFPLLGLKPLQGRFFLPQDEKQGTEPTAILTYAFWKSEFGSDPRALDQALILNGVAHRVVGVLPQSFRTPVPGPQGEPEIWRPLILPADPGARGGHYVLCVGRLKPGVTVGRAQAELDTLAEGIERKYPDTSTGWRTHVVPLREAMVGDVRAGLLALAAAVGLVLAIACANVASLLLGKAAARAREMAIRRTLGAGPWRIVRQVLTESLMLAAAGGVVGILLGSWTMDLLLSAASDSLPSWAEVRMDGGVLAFTLALSLLTGFLFGLAPALQGIRSDPGPFLQEAGDRGAVTPGRGRFRGALVGSQVALCVILLSGAALFVQSLWRLLHVDTGFRTENVMTLQISLPGDRYPSGERQSAFFRTLLERVETLPDVRAAGLVSILPLSGGYSGDSFHIDEHPALRPADEPTAEHRSVSPGYFSAMQIRLLRGRLLTGRDDDKAAPAAVINDAMARAFFPGEEPLGKHLSYNGVSREIVGVVGDVRHFGLAEEARPEYYFPLPQDPSEGMTLVVRGAGNPSPLLPALRESIRSLDGSLAAANPRTLEDLISRSVAQPRFRALILGAFAVLALLLAAVGIYGVVAHGVTRRTREIGVRMALGARRKDVLLLVIAQGMKLVALGVAAGLLGALAVTRALSGLLYGVGAGDPSTLAGVSILLGCVALAACYVPAYRASRVDPALALKCE